MDKLYKSPSRNKPLKLLDNVPLIPCNPHLEQPAEEDRRLANWHRRQLEHHRYQKHLGAKLKRKPSELALNAHEYSRSKKEIQSLIYEATKSDTPRPNNYCGNSIFSQLVQKSSNTGEESKLEGQDIYGTINSKDSRKRSQNVTRVALPNLIRKEKMLVESFQDIEKIQFHSKWEEGDYLRHRTTELKAAIQVLEPKKPETDNLIIIGKNFQDKPKEKFIRLPVITITSHDDGIQLLNYPDERIALKIQDREFVFERGYYFEKLNCEETRELRRSKEDLNSQKYAYSVFDTKQVYRIFSQKMPPIVWAVNFTAQGDEICERKFKLENKGIQIVTIDWRKVVPKLTSMPISNRIKSLFFFNKNPVSILPGQIVEVAIWFRSRRPIVATETWNLIIEPNIYPGTISIRLWATSKGSDWKLHEDKKNARIKEHLKTSVRWNIIRDVVETVLQVATSERAQKEVAYSKLFLEMNLFCARNPTYFYNSTLIAELKCIYKNATNQNDWSLMLKELHMILLRLGHDKKQNQLTKRFNDICIQSLQPISLYQHPLNPKRHLVYWLLCTLINKFEDESNFVFNKCCQHIDNDEVYEMENAYESEEIESENYEHFNTNIDHSLYYEIFYVRIYSLMCETIDRISAAVDSQICCD
ncbi:PREDICTED: MYCBP-associated protein-like [Ceratosolen solmsi marchali]|uniref:MYCBP-associated protein-like n=1 Tax=Ceratosolen solmsi marchali TaxID=326594 RepID=A0AAJ7DZ14_9HYME|nr:PREDICTED: MYCBP-associated protein-like [Ceratosolen solmsi marchali]